MVSGPEAEPQSSVSAQEGTLTPSNRSQATSLSGSAGGMERSESGLGPAARLRRSSSGGHVPARSPVLSPQSEGWTGMADPVSPDPDSWDRGVSGTSESGQRLLVWTRLCLR